VLAVLLATLATHLPGNLHDIAIVGKRVGSGENVIIELPEEDLEALRNVKPTPKE
jgi:hypothetical protein